MLIDEQHIVLKTGVKMGLQAKLDYDRIVVAVDVGVNAVEALEHVADERRESLWERYADAAGEHLFIVDIGLHPSHQVLDILGCGHLGRSLVVLTVLPQVLKSAAC